MDLRYKDKGTAIHKLHPVCKLAWIAGVFVLALIFDNPAFLLTLILSSLPLVAVARIWRDWATVMKFALYLCLAIIIINSIVSPHGTHTLARASFSLPVLGTPMITLEVIVFGVGMSLRLLAIISAFSLLTFTVHPDDVMLSMLIIRLPYKSVLVTSLSTRFVPALVVDAERITDARRTRGLEMDKGSLKQKIVGRTSVLIPLLSNSLDRTVQLAEAMESRAFGSGKGRTFYKELKFNGLDILCIVIAIVPLALGICLRISGTGNYRYYPTLDSMSLSSMDVCLITGFFISLVLLMIPAWIKKRTALD